MLVPEGEHLLQGNSQYGIHFVPWLSQDLKKNCLYFNRMGLHYLVWLEFNTYHFNMFTFIISSLDFDGWGGNAVRIKSQRTSYPGMYLYCLACLKQYHILCDYYTYLPVPIKIHWKIHWKICNKAVSASCKHLSCLHLRFLCPFQFNNLDKLQTRFYPWDGRQICCP